MMVVFEQKNNAQKHKILCEDKIRHQKKGTQLFDWFFSGSGP